MKSRLTGLLDLINTWLRVISEDIESIKEKFRPLLIEDVIVIALDTVDSHAIRKNIDINSSTANPLITVFGDEGTLAEVLVNLLDNSIKYSYPGSLVNLAAEIRGEQVVVSVSDSGVGISDEELPFVF
jgi:signal transduction histidine kinase